MVSFGRIFRKNYGNEKPKFRRATREETREINKDETLEEATRRHGESFFGQPYDTLSPAQKRYARKKAKDFRKPSHTMVRE